MVQLNSILNFSVIVALIVTSAFWGVTPAAPKPLPDDAHFVAQVQQPGTVLVKFGAEWCPPCRKIEQELDALAKLDTGDTSIVKIDIDKSPGLAKHYKISQIPQLILFRNGQQIGTIRGYRSREELKSWIARTR